MKNTLDGMDGYDGPEIVIQTNCNNFFILSRGRHNPAKQGEQRPGNYNKYIYKKLHEHNAPDTALR